MAITVKIAATSGNVAADAGTQFTTTGPFTLYGDYFDIGEVGMLYRLGPSGDYAPATNDKGAIYVSALPNMVYVDVPGTFRVSKPRTASVKACIGYEEI